MWAVTLCPSSSTLIPTILLGGSNLGLAVKMISLDYKFETDIGRIVCVNPRATQCIYGHSPSTAGAFSALFDCAIVAHRQVHL